ncbi:hypothetical protein B5F10_09930 [Anaerotruncus colihominis]|uniref:Phage holin, LL-H family n=2 Tax=Eubacteriales TaxID=186802 RepID=A0A1Y4N3C2_9FIRM|nr:phage holin, LLH family [Anaerotruncus colihominis]OUP68901.1 hypothetical protein B5F11_11140 [Anaerotruncus colihominis]OUP73712.1 hypothetical protein B5F10_09930 [Anaerotruncus colihominis]
MYDITPIIEAVAALIAALITAFLVPYIKSKTTAEQQKEINAWVKIAVSAAEQIYTGSGRGEEKKEYVINRLREHGITVDEAKLDALIEAAVYELNTNGIVPVIGIPDAVVTTTIETTTETPRRNNTMSEQRKKPQLNMRYYNGEIDDDLPYVGELHYDEETGLIYDEDGDVVDEKTLDAMLDGDGKGDDEDE